MPRTRTLGRLAATLASLLLAASLMPATAAELQREPPGPDEAYTVDFTIWPSGEVEVHRMPDNQGCAFHDSAGIAVAESDAIHLDDSLALGSGAGVTCRPDVLEVPDVDGGRWVRTCSAKVTAIAVVGAGYAYAGCGGVRVYCVIAGGACTAAAAGVPPAECGAWVIATHYARVTCDVVLSWRYVA